MPRAAWLALVMAAGCATPYIYRPEEQATARVAGRSAARYEIPAEEPKGEVKIAAFGITEVANGQRVIQLRMQLENDSDGQWQVDPRQQLLVFPNGQRVAPIAPTQLVTLGAGEKRDLDCFYPLPQEYRKASRLPEFDILWTVRTPARQIVQRTGFERIAMPNLGYYYYPSYYSWGPYPFYWRF